MRRKDSKTPYVDFCVRIPDVLIVHGKKREEKLC
jgi:hypothetical protein